MKKADAILLADVHLRETVPVCRTDNYEEAQWHKLGFIKGLQMKHGCPVLCGGDLFHHWKPSPELISKTIDFLPKQFYTVYGQHDLPQHSLELAYKSGVWTLAKANALTVLHKFHWGMTPDKKSSGLMINQNVAVWHHFAYRGKLPWPGYEGPTAKAILKKYPQFDLILTGDNHQTFVQEYKGRLLVNPGSIFRQTADQINHKPCVFLWYAKTNTVEQVFIPIAEDVISREHLEKQEERNERIDSFISSLNTNWESSLSFERNLKRFYGKNKVQERVKQIITESLEV